jgi:hypothetical protein
MEDQIHLYKFESHLPKDHVCHAWLHLVEQFNSRILKRVKESMLLKATLAFEHLS